MEQIEIVGRIVVEWTVGKLLVVGEGTGVELIVGRLLAGIGNEYVGEDLDSAGGPGAVVEIIVWE